MTRDDMLEMLADIQHLQRTVQNQLSKLIIKLECELVKTTKKEEEGKVATMLMLADNPLNKSTTWCCICGAEGPNYCQRCTDILNTYKGK